MNAPAVDRILTLDIVRGVAVMGILAMNIVAFAMPFEAYMNPKAYGLEGPADLASWAFSFVFVDGKMRGLFSFLFGASTPAGDRARRGSRPLAGEGPLCANALAARVRPDSLLLDLVRRHPRALRASRAVALFLFRSQPLQSLMIAGDRPGRRPVPVVRADRHRQRLVLAVAGRRAQSGSRDGRAMASMQEGFAPLSGQQLAENLALHRGSWLGLVEHG